MNCGNRDRQLSSDLRKNRRIVIGMSGTEGLPFGHALLKAVRDLQGLEAHLVLSSDATAHIEPMMGISLDEVKRLADTVHTAEDLAAPISSGSFRTAGMIIAPCSMRMLAAIATGNTSDLVSRAADVCLKERRKLVLVTTETPLSLIHLRNMEKVTLAGGVVTPAVPAFYHRPEAVDDLLLHTAGKALDYLDVQHDLFARWNGDKPAGRMDTISRG